MGWRLIIVTSNESRRAAVWLERTGLMALVDGLIGAEQSLRGKPAPDPYIAALDLAGVPPDRALVIEDSAQGAQAARSAGVSVIVYHPFGRPDCDWPKEVILCRDYDAIALAVAAIDKMMD
jgi:beta-phosphoglucomutase-like phosphatase (HAD superfamily)